MKTRAAFAFAPKQPLASGGAARIRQDRPSDPGQAGESIGRMGAFR